jgi:hypothetical protein
MVCPRGRGVCLFRYRIISREVKREYVGGSSGSGGSSSSSCSEYLRFLGRCVEGSYAAIQAVNPRLEAFDNFANAAHFVEFHL